MVRPAWHTDDPPLPSAQLANDLRAAIAKGEYPEGEKLPSIRELARTHHMAPATVQRALTVLHDEGLLTAWAGRGTFVRREPGGESQPDALEAIHARLDSIMDILAEFDKRLSAAEKARRRLPSQ
ncbi:GntR family transcriptional regulator [Amycolatopsis saalfeldensis]|uniref:Regulatory protein, gntR family n=1 Tax=Amycolatopsis saalfeldensis TaxID=394193 RepID=A0A1H8YK62_9PSEU|nr:GntR family transcriptional regulator [Amycolatopsis saalfeldensis]SEP52441.1 regulatory protein, gntR family [Amycolatopsis saalfeldensis]